MKAIHWLIIIIGFLSGGLFLFGILLNKDFVIGLSYFLVSVVMAIFIGFLTITELPAKFKMSKHLAILAPWLPMLIIILLLSFWDPILFVYAIAFPFVFIFSSIGGVIAYNIKMSKTQHIK